MNSFLILVWQEVISAPRKRWDTLVAGMFSGALGLLTMVCGFKRYLPGTAYESTFATGWVAYTMVLAGVAGSIAATVDLSLGRIRYLLSLPVTPVMIASSKMCGATATSFLVSLAMLALGNPLVLHLSFPNALWALGALMLQALSIVGIMCTLSPFVADMTKLGLVGSIAAGSLQYLSSVYFPPEVFPAWVRPIIYINPLTYSVNFFRSLVRKEPAHFAFVYLAASASLCVGLGVWSLTRSLVRRMR